SASNAGANDARLISELVPLMRSSHYLKVSGAPLLLVCNVDDILDPIQTTERWRTIFRQNGIARICLASVQPHDADSPGRYGFDAAVEAPPLGRSTSINRARIDGIKPGFPGSLEDYIAIALSCIHEDPVNYVRFPGVMPGWDETALHRNHPRVFINRSPKAYAHWLRHLVRE